MKFNPLLMFGHENYAVFAILHKMPCFGMKTLNE